MAAVLLGALLVIPFMGLEYVNGGGFSPQFPVALFLFMWLQGTSFFLAVAPVVRRLGMNPFMTLRMLPAVALSCAIAWLWISLVADQMPCFLGVPNCD